ncbi:MAG TPA: deoxyribonuclease V [Pyrinomonadaceae bacterium]|jgi:deoxyribonuclease V|nr:deoxyribonuclease V [Pyrinomonadaceae bacterium]
MAHYEQLHDWALRPREAVELQKRLRERVLVRPHTGKKIETIAGADISFNKFSPVIYTGIVVLSLPSLEVLEEVGLVGETQFPYVPGLLSFREAPSVLEAWSKLKIEPDAVMFDGQGIAHPRRVGIASHVGLFLNRPTLGCAKSVLVGRHAELAEERGSWQPLIDPKNDETVGAALRTKTRVQPIYVSPGHLIDLAGAIELTLRSDDGYRQPEPTRRAHLLVNALRRGEREAT